MNMAELELLCDGFLGAWTEQNVEKVAAFYTDDVVYRDPNTRGDVRGGDALRRYLRRLFSEWRMTWTRRELHPTDTGAAAALLWHATFSKAAGEQVVEADGMDLLEFRDGRVSRNEVYFDRTVLAALLSPTK